MRNGLASRVAFVLGTLGLTACGGVTGRARGTTFDQPAASDPVPPQAVGESSCRSFYGMWSTTPREAPDGLTMAPFPAFYIDDAGVVAPWPLLSTEEYYGLPFTPTGLYRYSARCTDSSLAILFPDVGPTQSCSWTTIMESTQGSVRSVSRYNEPTFYYHRVDDADPEFPVYTRTQHVPICDQD